MVYVIIGTELQLYIIENELNVKALKSNYIRITISVRLHNDVNNFRTECKEFSIFIHKFNIIVSTQVPE